MTTGARSVEWGDVTVKCQIQESNVPLVSFTILFSLILRFQYHMLISLSHDEDCESRPPSEWFTALALPCLVIVLLPHVPGPGVLPQHVGHHVLPEQAVHLAGQLLVWPLHCPVVVQSSDGQEVDVDPDGSSPVGGIMFCVLLHV